MTTSPTLLDQPRPTVRRQWSVVREHRADPIAWTASALLLGCGVTAMMLFSDWFPAGYRAGPLSAEVNAFDGCVALLVAFLSHGHFVRDRRIRHRLIAHGLAVLGMTSLALPVAALLLPTDRNGTSLLWASAILRLVGAGLVAAGAIAGDRTIRRMPRRGVAVGAPVGLLLVVLLATTVAGPVLPPALMAVRPGAAVPLLFTSDPVFAAIQLLCAVGFLLAAVVLTRLAVVHPGDLIGPMGPAFALGTFALVQYALFPTLTTDWLYSGDLLRTSCYALLLIGAAVEIRRYWTGQSRAAVLEDRRRLAREIHDGVVQEISYIRMETRSMPPSEGADRIVDACDRALDEARDAVHALALSNDEPLAHQLQRAAHDLSRRYGMQVVLRLEDAPTPDADQRHGLVRIVREAIANAARHGAAATVVVALSRSEIGWILEVRDDGRGFDSTEVSATAGGYGLISMRERADALPGRCVVESQPGHGTTVRVTW
jgi:signal transduction histidine kinase